MARHLALVRGTGDPGSAVAQSLFEGKAEPAGVLAAITR